MDSIKEASIKFCNAHPTCSQCPIGDSGSQSCLIYAITQIDQSPEEVIGTAIKWAKEHPEDVRTYADDFFEKFGSAVVSPRASASGRKIPLACRNILYGINGGNCSQHMKCMQCWQTPIPMQQ